MTPKPFKTKLGMNFVIGNGHFYRIISILSMMKFCTRSSSLTPNVKFFSTAWAAVIVGFMVFPQVIFAQTTTFNYTGTIVTYTVPAGITSIQIECWGAQGGTSNGNGTVLGGLGARMRGDLLLHLDKY